MGRELAPITGNALPPALAQVNALVSAGLNVQNEELFSLLKAKARRQINADIKAQQKKLDQTRRDLKDLHKQIESVCKAEVAMRLGGGIGLLAQAAASLGWTALKHEWAVNFSLNEDSPTDSQYSINQTLYDPNGGRGYNSHNMTQCPTQHVVFSGRLAEMATHWAQLKSEERQAEADLGKSRLRLARMPELEDEIRGALAEHALSKCAEGKEIIEFLENSDILKAFID